MPGCENSTTLSIGEKRAIADEWLALTAGAYPAPAAGRLLTDTDPFRNPVGEAFRRGLPVLLDAALGEAGWEAAAAVLDELLRIRSVQAATAAEAVSFISLLKPILGQHAAGCHRIEERVGGLEAMALEAWSRSRSALESVRENERRRRNFLPARMHGL